MVTFGALSNDQINRYMSRYPQWGGCICNDDIWRVPTNTRKCWIINLQDSNQPGSHWVLISCLKATIFYWDPFGVLPTRDVHDWVRSTGRPARYCNADIQAFQSEACGYYCMYIAGQLIQGRTPVQIIRAFQAAGPDHERLLRTQF